MMLTVSVQILPIYLAFPNNNLKFLISACMEAGGPPCPIPLDVFRNPADVGYLYTIYFHDDFLVECYETTLLKKCLWDLTIIA